MVFLVKASLLQGLMLFTSLSLVCLYQKIEFDVANNTSSATKRSITAESGSKKVEAFGSEWTKSSKHALPVDFGNRCVTLRVRGYEDSYTIDEAVHLISAISGTVRVGLEFVEDPEGFISLEKHDAFHLFHFLEFLTVSFSQLERLNRRETIESSNVQVPWIYVPHMTRDEICGLRGMNCLMGKIVLNSTDLAIHGLESNPVDIQEIDPMYVGVYSKRKRFAKTEFVPESPKVQQSRYDNMIDQVDVIMLINRAVCIKNQRTKNLHKMWTDYIEDFPSHAWSRRVQYGISHFMANDLHDKVPAVLNPSSTKPVIGYIDRQNTRRQLPNQVHKRIVSILYDDDRVDFRHLHMEDYTPVQQMYVASQCDMLIGMHGNGLSHLLWMKPGSLVMEWYWKFGFHFDYASSARMMQHDYVGIFDLKPMNLTQTTGLDPILRGLSSQQKSDEATSKQIETAIRALKRTVDKVVSKKKAMPRKP